MGTNYIAPTWRQPENLNKDRLSNYSIQWQDGNLGNIISFQADADSSTNPFLPSTTNAKMSLSAFFNLQGGSGERIIISEKVSGSATHWKLSINTNDQLEFVARTDAGLPYYTTIIGGTTISDNSWHHVALAWDGSNFNLYLDGVSDATPVAASTFYYNPAYTSWGDIGGQRYNPNAISNRFSGQLSQICYFDYSLSTDQVTYLSNMNDPMVISGAEPIAYWPLGDNSNPTATAGYPNIVSAADSVFDFESGDNAFIKAFDVPVATFTEATFSAWVNFESITGSYQYVMGMGSGPGNFMSISLWSGGSTWYTYDGTTAQTTSTGPSAGKWYNVVVTQTGTTRRFYINGVEDANSPFTVNALAIPYNNLTLGAYNASSSATPSTLHSLDGQLSNVQVWDKKIEQADITTLYNNGTPLMTGTQPEEANLRAWYKLNQSAVLTPGNPTNWTITKIGSPNYSQSGDGCFNVTVAGALEWHDNNYNQLSDGNYFQWNSPTIYTSGSNIVLSSTGGSHYNPFYANEISLEYSIDGGSFVVWHTQVIPTAYGAAFTIPSTGNLTVSNNIRIIVKGVDRGSGGSYLRLLDVSATGGTTNYTESFGGTKYGWYGGAENNPPATFSADHWDIPDNRSAYPQSFDFNGIDDLITLNKQSGWEDNQVHCISLWIKNQNSGIGYVISNRGGSSVAPGFSFIVNGTSTGYIFSNTVTSKIATGYQAALKIPNDGEWHHVLWTHQPITNILRAYIDGVYKYTKTGSVGTDATPSVGALIGNSGGAPWKGKLSNIMLWEQIVLSDGNVSLSNSASGQVAEVYNNGVPLPTASVEPSNLKAWYKLDKPTSIWNETNWEVENQVYPTGFDSALNFDGSSGVNVSAPTYPYSPKFSEASDISISFWMRTDKNIPGSYNRQFAVGCWHSISSTGSSLGTVSHNYTDWTKTIARVGNSYGSTKLNDGNWHHIVYTFQFSNGQAYGYVDGNSTAEVSATLNNGATLFWALYIGGLGFNNTYDFDGQVSNVLYYNKVITGSEATTLYNNGAPQTSPSFSPDGWWKCDNLTTGIEDSVGSNNGTNDGATKVSTFVSTSTGVSDGMTEANLIDENVSTVNAESDTLPGTALVQSDLTRKLPFSNYSINLDGTNHFDLGTNPSLDIFGADFSVSLWFKTTDTATASGLFQIGGFTKNFAITKGNDVGNIGFVVNTNTWFYNIGSGLNDGDWHNVIVVNSNNNYTVYIDSVSYDSFSSGSYNTGSHNSIGKGHNNSFYFDGYLSNIAVYNRAISNEEALDLYNNGVTQDLNNSFTPGQPYFWWPLDAKYTYFDGTDLVVREIVSGSDGNGQNTEQHDIVGNAPGSTANGIGSNLTIADLKGDMKNSTNNSYSINMADYADGVTNPASSGRSTIIP